MGINYGRLCLDERIELWRHHDAGTAPSEIARIRGRHPRAISANSGATVDRRLASAGLGGSDGVLAPSTKLVCRAPEPAEGSYRRPPCDGLVAPEQIAGRLRLEGSEHRVSHEMIYRYS